jgi:hypothetical protein
MLHAAVAAAILTALSLIGFAATPRTIRPASSRLSVPFSLSAGTLLVGMTAWVVGSTIGTVAILPLEALLLAASLLRCGEWARAVRRVGRELGRLARANIAAAIAAIGLIALLLPQLLLPAVDSDGLRYHLALPKLFLLSGRIFFYPWDQSGSYPQLAESIYLIAMRLGGGETAKFIHAGYFIASLAVLGLLVHRNRNTRRAALLAAALFAAAPVVVAPATAAFIDHAALFHLATAALLLTRRAHPAASGLALASALTTKLTPLPAIAALALYGLWSCWSRRAHAPRPAALPVAAAALLLPMLLAFAPFGIRAWIERGDPIYPMGYALLGRSIPGVASDRLAYATQYHSSLPGPLGIGWTPGLEVQEDEVAGIHHAIGLFALALCIRNRAARRYLLLILPLLAMALVAKPPTRYLIPMFFGLAALEAEAALVLFRRLGTAVALALAIPGAMAAVTLLLTFNGPADYLLGRLSRTAFLESRLLGYRAVEAVNRQPPGGRVMALDLPIPYYFNRPWIVEGVLYDPPLVTWVHQGRTAEAIRGALRALDVRYLVVTPGYGGGTRASLLSIARSPAEAATILELRRAWRRVATVDSVDVFALGP